MKTPWWLSDTIARRFAGTQVLALVVTLALIGLFYVFGGVWSQEPLETTGLLNEAADIARMAEATAPQQRASLASAATTSRFTVNWYPGDSAVARALDSSNAPSSDSRALRRYFDGAARKTVTFSPDSRQKIPAGIAYNRNNASTTYMLAVLLSDQSWLVFTALSRTWGLPMFWRETVWLCFLAISILLVSAFAARQVAKPVKELANAVRRFRIDAEATPIAETGPREIRNVIKIFNDMQAQIRKFVAYRTTMLAAMSHDLRTPLTRIRLRGEFIEDPEQQRRLFRDVDEMQEMIDGALAFYRDDAVSEEVTGIDLAALLLTITNDYADQHIEVSYVGPAHAPYAGRPVALKRAFTNVMDNAIKYATPPAVELISGVSQWIVSIKDRGPGIPPDAIDAVFRPYYRADRSRNRGTGGVGLGLTAAQAIFRGHGGDIALSNMLPRGLEARITLPLEPQTKDGLDDFP
jgi:signal transduction histidine kinase